MDLWSAGVLAFLASSVPSAEASGWGINNPKVCYILDVILLLYGLIMTALLIREKFRKRKASSSDGLYADLQPHGGSYEPLRPRNDPETGRGNRRQAGDDLYTRRRNKSEQVYQGLSSATKDTYDSLHMQPMPPRR